jgi:hypothetical protein
MEQDRRQGRASVCGSRWHNRLCQPCGRSLHSTRRICWAMGKGSLQVLFSPLISSSEDCVFTSAVKASRNCGGRRHSRSRLLRLRKPSRRTLALGRQCLGTDSYLTLIDIDLILMKFRRRQLTRNVAKYLLLMDTDICGASTPIISSMSIAKAKA